MSPTLLVAVVVGGFFGFVIMLLLVVYNRLVGMRNKVDQAFGDLDVHLKKRYDLIPNLVDSCKEYMEHERETLTELTEMRARAISGQAGADERIALDTKISGGLSRLFGVMENYPDLKANTNILDLQKNLSSVEAEIAGERVKYNEVVTSYNTATQQVPTSLVAGMFGFGHRALFEASEAERENVDVGKLFDK